MSLPNPNVRLYACSSMEKLQSFPIASASFCLYIVEKNMLSCWKWGKNSVMKWFLASHALNSNPKASGSRSLRGMSRGSLRVVTRFVTHSPSVLFVDCNTLYMLKVVQVCKCPWVLVEIPRMVEAKDV